MKIEKAIENLSKKIKESNIEKINNQKYSINSDLMLLENFDVLPIFLVEINDKLMFADYGKVAKDLEITEGQKEIFNKFLSSSNVIFDDGRLILETNVENIFYDYNVFVMAIMFLQVINF